MYFNQIINRLENNGSYNVHNKVINSKDQGIPQCRERLYIIGILKSDIKKEFVFPQDVKMKPLEKFIDNTCNTKIDIKPSNYNLFKKIPEDSIFIDIGFREAKFPNSNKHITYENVSQFVCLVFNRKKVFRYVDSFILMESS